MRALSEGDLSFEHLQAELARIDLLIRREIRRCQLAGQDPSDSFRGLCVSDVQASALLQRPFGTSWGQLAVFEEGEAQAFAEAERRATHLSHSIAQAAHQQGQAPRL